MATLTTDTDSHPRAVAKRQLEKEVTTLKETLDKYIKDKPSYTDEPPIKISEMEIGKVYLIANWNGPILVKMVNKYTDNTFTESQTRITSKYINTKKDQYEPSKQIEYIEDMKLFTPKDEEKFTVYLAIPKPPGGGKRRRRTIRKTRKVRKGRRKQIKSRHRHI